MVAQTGVGLGKDHGLAAAAEVFELQHRHAVALAGGDLANFAHHDHRTHLDLVGLFLQGGQGQGGEQLQGAAELLERVVRQVKAHQLLLEPQFFVAGVVAYRSGLGRRRGGAGRRQRSIDAIPTQQVEQVALTASPVAGP